MAKDRLSESGERRLRASMKRMLALPGHAVVVAMPGGMPNPAEEAAKAVQMAADSIVAGGAHLPDDISWHITVRHEDGCPSRGTRDQADCTCEDLIIEGVPLSPFQAAVVEATGAYDEEVVLGDDGDVIELKFPEGDKLDSGRMDMN